MFLRTFPKSARDVCRSRSKGIVTLAHSIGLSASVTFEARNNFGFAKPQFVGKVAFKGKRSQLHHMQNARARPTLGNIKICATAARAPETQIRISGLLGQLVLLWYSAGHTLIH